MSNFWLTPNQAASCRGAAVHLLVLHPPCPFLAADAVVVSGTVGRDLLFPEEKSIDIIGTAVYEWKRNKKDRGGEVINQVRGGMPKIDVQNVKREKNISGNRMTHRKNCREKGK